VSLAIVCFVDDTLRDPPTLGLIAVITGVIVSRGQSADRGEAATS
jgi:hypothetical protein